MVSCSYTGAAPSGEFINVWGSFGSRFCRPAVCASCSESAGVEESKRGRGSVQMPGGPTRAHGACVAQSPPLAAAWGSSGHRVAPSTRVSSGLAAPRLEWEPADSRAGPPRPGGPVANLTQPGRGREGGAAEVRRSGLETQLPASAPSQWLLSATPHPVSQVGN